MKITEVESNSKIKVPKTNRNKVICDSIKPPLPNKVFTALISARPNSGKSVLCESLISKQYKKCFDSVIICVPPTSRSCFENSCLEHVDEAKTFDELNEETVEEIYDLIVENRDKGDDEGEEYYSLLLLDDQQVALKSKMVEKRIRGILANYRHLNCVVLCCVQNYMSVPKQCRDLFRCLFQFATPSRIERQRIHDEWAGSLDNTQFSELVDYVWDKKHNFLFCDRQTDTFHKNLNRLKLDTREPKKKKKKPTAGGPSEGIDLTDTIDLTVDDSDTEDEDENIVAQLPYYKTVAAIEKLHKFQIKVIEGVRVTDVVTNLKMQHLKPYLVYRWVDDAEFKYVKDTKQAFFKIPTEKSDVLNVGLPGAKLMYAWSTLDMAGAKYGKSSKGQSNFVLYITGITTKARARNRHIASDKTPDMAGITVIKDVKPPAVYPVFTNK